jgi:Lrp/AsnC family transcriptional regulator for asnA, asnC and gidA
MLNIDSLDRGILSVLRDNGRAPYVDIAKAVGVTERTVRTRMRKLEEEGVIRGYTVREAGIGLSALIRMKIGAGTEIGSLAGEFAGWNGVESVYEISGDAD